MFFIAIIKMKRFITLLLSVFFVLFSGCEKQKIQYGVIPQGITVTGKVDNYDPNRQVTVYIKRIGLEQENITAKIDSAGYFTATFESYIPLDVVIGYKTNFYVLLHPGDSLFVRFDGNCDNLPELLETIAFGGDRAKTNRYAAKYQQLYFANELYTDWDKKDKTVKEYDTEQYLLYLDTVKQKSKEIYDRFVAENRPDEESKRWALLFSERDYFHYLSFYAIDHRRANNMGWDNDWDVPKGFYDSLCNRLPIDPSMFISAGALNSFSASFKDYVDDNMRGRESTWIDEETGIEYTNWAVLPRGGLIAPVEIWDSIKIFSTIEFVPDSLLLQIMLTRFFDSEFEKQEITAYEQYGDVVDTYIKEPFLKEPLHQKYLQTKSRIENPQIYTGSFLKEATNLSVNQIINDILQPNKGKVIYVDFWATWCGPCLAEMPNSKVLEHELKDRDVVFVYICLESEEKLWTATLDKYQLGGQHFFLSLKQSADIRKLFEISGIPFYLLIDKNGAIIEKGSHLRPLNIREKILREAQ